MRFRQGMTMFLLVSALTSATQAQPPQTDPNAKILKLITTTKPKVRVRKVDRDTLSVHRIDVVDKRGVIRMTIAGDVPDPVVDGIAYHRSQQLGGILLRDDKGNERGGYAFASNLQLPLMTLDYPNGEAIGFNVWKDGSINLLLLSRPPDQRDPALGKARLPGGPQYAGIRLSMSADGVPSIDINDKENNPRLRLTVTADGYGALEFLNAKGDVVRSIIPEKSGS